MPLQDSRGPQRATTEDHTPSSTPLEQDAEAAARAVSAYSKQPKLQPSAGVGRPATRARSCPAVAAAATHQKKISVQRAQSRLLVALTAGRVRGSMQTFDTEGTGLALALGAVSELQKQAGDGAGAHLNLDEYPLHPSDLYTLFEAIQLCLPRLSSLSLASLSCVKTLAARCADQLEAFVSRMTSLVECDVPHSGMPRPSLDRIEALLEQHRNHKKRKPTRRKTRAPSDQSAIMNDPDEPCAPWDTSSTDGRIVNETLLPWLAQEEHNDRVSHLQTYILETANLIAQWRALHSVVT